MKFKVSNGNAFFAQNALKSGDRAATEKQSEQYHEFLLDPRNDEEYFRLMTQAERFPAMRPMIEELLHNRAKAREKSVPEYWNDDEMPRRPIAQSSSWVGDFDFKPDASIVTIALGNKGKSVTIHATPKDVQNYVNADSIGKKVNSDILKR